jgi:hypothetical protein
LAAVRGFAVTANYNRLPPSAIGNTAFATGAKSTIVTDRAGTSGKRLTLSLQADPAKAISFIPALTSAAAAKVGRQETVIAGNQNLLKDPAVPSNFATITSTGCTLPPNVDKITITGSVPTGMAPAIAIACADTFGNPNGQWGVAQVTAGVCSNPILASGDCSTGLTTGSYRAAFVNTTTGDLATVFL